MNHFHRGGWKEGGEKKGGELGIYKKVRGERKSPRFGGQTHRDRQWESSYRGMKEEKERASAVEKCGSVRPGNKRRAANGREPMKVPPPGE